MIVTFLQFPSLTPTFNLPRRSSKKLTVTFQLFLNFNKMAARNRRLYTSGTSFRNAQIQGWKRVEQCLKFSRSRGKIEFESSSNLESDIFISIYLSFFVNFVRILIKRGSRFDERCSNVPPKTQKVVLATRFLDTPQRNLHVRFVQPVCNITCFTFETSN